MSISEFMLMTSRPTSRIGFAGIKLSEHDQQRRKAVVGRDQQPARISLCDVGLGYLTLKQACQTHLEAVESHSGFSWQRH